MSIKQEIRNGDCIEEMQQFPDNHFHAVVTDPPYNFEGGFMDEEWDDIGSAKEYQEWCGAWASECLRVLKPGGHLIAFGGSRTEHRLKSGVEDAGFEIRDTITWHYSDGFPKGSDIGKHIDKYGGNAGLGPEIADTLKEARKSRGITKTRADEMFCDGSSNYRWYEGRTEGQRIPDDETFAEIAAEWPELQPYYEQCKEAEREVVGLSEHASGIANGTEDHYTVGGTVAEHYEITAPATSEAERWSGWKQNLKPTTEFGALARAPLADEFVYENVVLHGTGALNIEGAEIAGEDRTRHPSNTIFGGDVVGGLEEQWGGASRYFYTPKTSKQERTIGGRVENNHATVKPLSLMEWVVTLITDEGQRVLDPFAGSGTTLMACRRLGREGIGIEMDEEYAETARERVKLAHELETDFVSTTDPSNGQADLQAFADGDNP